LSDNRLVWKIDARFASSTPIRLLCSRNDGEAVSTLRRFLVKLNARNCPDEIGRPDNAADWEEKIFKTGIPLQESESHDLTPERTRNPEPGDHLLIWINDGEGGGTGLTATAKVSHFSSPEMTVKSIELFPAPRLDRTDLGRMKRRAVFHDLARLRTTKLRCIDHEEWAAIHEEAAAKVLLSEEAAQEIARQKILGEQATRRAQQQFSETMRINYRRRCAITGCNTSAALQAAHIRVLKDADDNRPENGILLRSDIHALFDALLITLSEDGATVEISETLIDPSYEFLRNAPVSQPEIGPRPSRKNIRDHRKRFFCEEK
jgi:HNH endonuclease